MKLNVSEDAQIETHIRYSAFKTINFIFF